MDVLAQRVQSYLFSKMPQIRRSFAVNCSGLSSDDEGYDSFLSDKESCRHSVASEHFTN